MKVLEEFGISPLPSASPTSISTTSLIPLTFLDIPWLLFPPSKPLFFYHFPYPTSHFTSTLLPNLKLSLSLTLKYFYPFAGTLFLPPQSGKPEILIGVNDSVSFTIAESNGEFNHLSSLNNQRDVKELQTLAPQLGGHDDDDDQYAGYAPSAEKLPLLAIRVTVFPNSGFCLGFAFHHVVSDGRTFNNFMKLWSLFCSSCSNSTSTTIDHYHEQYSLFFPSYDRTVIIDSRGLEAIFLKEWWERKALSVQGHQQTSCQGINETNNVDTTFLMGLVDIENIKTWVLNKTSEEESHSLDFSPYVLTCAFLWVCVLKSQVITKRYASKSNDPNYFGFVAGGLSRVGYPVPATYLGNCVGFGRAMATRGELLGEDGILVAAKSIRSTVKRLNGAVFDGAEKWISEWEELIGSDIHVMVSGSPKLDFYERDFGWGRPKKIDDIEIKSTKAISLTESRDIKGGMEIGLVLPKPEMDVFTVLFKEGLKALS